MEKRKQYMIGVSKDTHELIKKLAGDIPLSKYVKRLAEKELANATK